MAAVLMFPTSRVPASSNWAPETEADFLPFLREYFDLPLDSLEDLVGKKFVVVGKNCQGILPEGIITDCKIDDGLLILGTSRKSYCLISGKWHHEANEEDLTPEDIVLQP